MKSYILFAGFNSHSGCSEGQGAHDAVGVFDSLEEAWNKAYTKRGEPKYSWHHVAVVDGKKLRIVKEDD